MKLNDLEVLRAFKRVVGFAYAYRFWLKYFDVAPEVQQKIRIELRCDLAELEREEKHGAT